ncbi:MAG: hypothetical protein BMS9Abin05_1967 [Rhodothermia bacterium]|nr:MAG: hypothetical protein BMS9Abin05_1967 [Rhodothermia bacterium]
MISIHHDGPTLLRLGFIKAEALKMDAIPEGFETRLESLLQSRREGLSETEDSWRQSVRDILRNGTYKPTGRGKPASEYLIRASAEEKFPRINAPVDVCNYISLFSLLPVSVWDLNRAGSSDYTVRLGFEGEDYEFNAVGQRIDLNDLVVGCAVSNDRPDGLPVVNPVKDSLATKTSDRTQRVGAIIYARNDDGPTGPLETICDLFRDLLSMCGEESVVASCIVLPGLTVRI